jgi:hypothetical protein
VTLKVSIYQNEKPRIKVEDYEIVERTNEQIHDHEVDGNQKHTKLVIYMGCQQTHGYIGV